VTPARERAHEAKGLDYPVACPSETCHAPLFFGGVLASGGGIHGGRVHGASDRTGAYPSAEPARPDDITATVFHALGFDPKTLIHDQLKRPMPISAGRPIAPLFA
jgi:hypothetical protein